MGTAGLHANIVNNGSKSMNEQGGWSITDGSFALRHRHRAPGPQRGARCGDDTVVCATAAYAPPVRAA